MQTSLKVGLLCSMIVVGGCATGGGATYRPRVEVRLADGAFWVDPDDVDRYICDVGQFTCRSDGGRRTQRFCECVP
jgi:hypothetical protein